MGDEELGRMFSRSSRESLGKGGERKRAMCPRGSWSRWWNGKICTRMDEAFEGGFESKASNNCTSCSLVPLKSSWRIRFDVIVGSIRISRAESGSWGRHIRKRGTSLERELNKGHALTAPATHQPQSKGKLTATSFQRLQTWRKQNVPVTKRVSPSRRPDSTMRRNTSANSSIGRRETAAREF